MTSLVLQKPAMVIIVYKIFSQLGPVPPSGRRTYTGSSDQDTVRAGTFWRKTMNNQPGTMKNRPGTMKTDLEP